MLMVAGMLISGTANTLLTKFQMRHCVENCDGKDKQNYEQPVWQTLNMFIGESMCLVVFFIMEMLSSPKAPPFPPTEDEDPSLAEKQRLLTENRDEEAADAIDIDMEIEDDLRELKGWANLWLWLPSLFDIVGTTLMNAGLIYVAASIYQMLRGAVVVFTGIMSVLFLNAKMPAYRIFALLTIVFGVAIVGMSPVLFGSSAQSSENANAVLGIGLILFAQIFTACQFVVEEKIIMKYRVKPIKMVGLEGVFGLSTVAVLMTILHFAYGHDRNNDIFDIVYGYQVFISQPGIWGTAIAICFSIAFFNWFGLNITKYVSATSRSTIDSCRTLFVWLGSLAFSWEEFIVFQILGFAVLIYGTFIFNNVIPPVPFTRCLKPKQ